MYVCPRDVHVPQTKPRRGRDFAHRRGKLPVHPDTPLYAQTRLCASLERSLISVGVKMIWLQKFALGLNRVDFVIKRRHRVVERRHSVFE